MQFLLDSDGWSQETIPNSRRAALHQITEHCAINHKLAASIQRLVHSLTVEARLSKVYGIPCAKKQG